MSTEYTRYSAKVLLEAADIQERKGQDYNNAVSSVEQADYYPRGVTSILDIVNAKYLRMVSVLETMEQGGKVNFESIEDSAIDMINYASFVVAYMRGEVPGQDPKNDIFNRKSDGNQALVPTKFKLKDKIVLSSNGAGYNINSGAGVSSETIVVNGGSVTTFTKD
jgi:hypothetical protein